MVITVTMTGQRHSLHTDKNCVYTDTYLLLVLSGGPWHLTDHLCTSHTRRQALIGRDSSATCLDQVTARNYDYMMAYSYTVPSQKTNI